MSRRITVCPARDLPPGQRRIVQADEKISLGVFNVDGHYYALRNLCPHRLAPLCLGPLSAQVTSDGPGNAQLRGAEHIVRCPWHGWEFDTTTGKSVFNPHKVRVRTYPVTVETACNPPAPDEPTDEFIDTYPVTIEQGMVVVLLP